VAQGAEVLDIKDQVIAVERDGVAVHGEILVGDVNGNVIGKGRTGDMVTVGNHHIDTVAIVEAQAHGCDIRPNLDGPIVAHECCVHIFSTTLLVEQGWSQLINLCLPAIAPSG